MEYSQTSGNAFQQVITEQSKKYLLFFSYMRCKKTGTSSGFNPHKKVNNPATLSAAENIRLRASG
jgi:hypothetical protein